MFSSIPGHYSLPVISNFLPIVAMKNVSRHCQRVLWGQNCPQWRTDVLWGHLRSSCPPPLPIVPSLSPLRSLLPCKYFHDASQLRFRALSAMLFGIINLSNDDHLQALEKIVRFVPDYFISEWLSLLGADTTAVLFIASKIRNPSCPPQREALHDGRHSSGRHRVLRTVQR